MLGLQQVLHAGFELRLGVTGQANEVDDMQGCFYCVGWPGRWLVRAARNDRGGAAAAVAAGGGCICTTPPARLLAPLTGLWMSTAILVGSADARIVLPVPETVFGTSLRGNRRVIYRGALAKAHSSSELETGCYRAGGIESPSTPSP